MKRYFDTKYGKMQYSLVLLKIKYSLSSCNNYIHELTRTTVAQPLSLMCPEVDLAIAAKTDSFCGIHQAPCVRREARLRSNPIVVVGDLCVNSWFVPAGTAVAPAHHAIQEHPATCLAHQRAARVTLRGGDMKLSPPLQW